MNEKLSVIVPVYNAEKYISRCLDSICKQTYENLQIIIVNDGSTDKSFQVCREYQTNDMRIELYSQQNSGVGAARNTGLSNVKGEYLTFVDADDYLDLNAYEIAMNRINEADALFFAYEEKYLSNRINRKMIPQTEGVVNSEEALYQCFLPVGYFTSVWNKIFKADIAKRVYFKEVFKISEDEIWLVEVLKKTNEIILIKDVLYNYVQNSESTTHTDFKINNKWISELKAKELILSLLDRKSVCYDQFEAKTYNDLFHLLWFAYITGDKGKFKQIKTKLSYHKKAFLCSNMYSIKRKTRYQIVNFMMNLSFPKNVVYFFGNITTFKLKTHSYN